MAPSTTGTNSESDGGFFECEPNIEDEDYHSIYSGSSVSANSLSMLQHILNASYSNSEPSSARSMTSDSDTNVSMYGNDFMVGIDTTEEYTTDQTDTDLDETQKTEFTRNTDDAVCSEYEDSDYEHAQKMTSEEFQRDIRDSAFQPSPAKSPGKSLMSGSLVSRSEVASGMHKKRKSITASSQGSLVSGTIDDLDDLSDMDYKILADSLMSGDMMSISSSDGDGTVSSFSSAFSDMTKLRSLLRGEMPTSSIQGSDSEHSNSVPSSRVISPVTVDGNVGSTLDKVQEIDDENSDGVSHQSYASESVEAAAARMIEESMQKIKAEEKAQNWVTKLKADREHTAHKKAEMDALLKIIDGSKTKAEVNIPIQADVKATTSDTIDGKNYETHQADSGDDDEETVYTAQEFEHKSDKERWMKWEEARRLAEEQESEKNAEKEQTEGNHGNKSSNEDLDSDDYKKQTDTQLLEAAKAAAQKELQQLKEKKAKRLTSQKRKGANKKKNKINEKNNAEAEAQRLKEEEEARIAAEFERLAIEQATIDNIRRQEEEIALQLAEDSCVSPNVVIEESDSAHNLDASFQTAELDIDQDNDLTFLSQSTGQDGDDSVLEEQARYEEEADELRLLTESFSSNSTPTRAKNELLKIKTMEDSAPYDGVKSDMLISPNTQPTVDDGISSPASSDAKISSPGKNDPPAPAEPANCGCCVIS